MGTFLVLAFGITWIVWVPRAFTSQHPIDAPWAVEIGAVWGWGPAVAALITAALVGGRSGLRDWSARLVRWRVGGRWYLVALLGPAAFWLACAGLLVLLGYGWTDVRPRVLGLGVVATLPLFAALVVTDGIGEEAGWRGYALPQWLTLRGPLAASIGLGLVWALWHLPLVFTAGSALDGSPVAYHLLDLPATAVFYTWLFLRTRGSVRVGDAAARLDQPVDARAIPAGTITQLAVVLVAKWLLVGAVLLTGLAPEPRSDRGVRRFAGPGTTT